MLKIKVFKDSKLIHDVALESNYISLGRASDNSIILEDDTISRHHAILFLSQGQLYIRDLNSKNKILINNFEFQESLLSINDEISIGAYVVSIVDFKDEANDLTQEYNRVIIDNLNETNPDDFKFNSPLETLIQPFDQSIEIESEESVKGEHLFREDSSVVCVSVFLGDTLFDYRYFTQETKEIICSSQLKLAHSLFIPGLDKNLNLISFDGQWRINPELNFEQKENYFLVNLSPFWIKVELNQSLMKLGLLPKDQLDPLTKKSMLTQGGLFLLFLALIPFMSPPKIEEKEEEIAIVYKAKPIIEEVKPEKKTGGSSGAAGAESNSKTSKAQNISKTFNNAGVMKALARLTQSPTGAIAMNQQGTKDVSSGEAFGATTKSGRGLSALGGGSGGEGLGFGKGNLGVSEGVKGVGDNKGIHYGEATTKTVMMGSIDPEEIRKILEKHLPQFRHCYQRELDRVKTLKGLIDLEFTIGKEGRVVKTDIKSKEGGFSNDGVGCLSSVLKIIQFPSPKGGGIVDVRQPLNFYSDT